MCGIVGAVCQRNVYKILIEGLNRLEYRGYDSAGLSVLDADQILQTRKTFGKVADLKALCKTDFAVGNRVLPILAGLLTVSRVVSILTLTRLLVYRLFIMGL